MEGSGVPDPTSPDPTSPDSDFLYKIATQFGDDADNFRQGLIDCRRGKTAEARRRLELLTQKFDQLCEKLLSSLEPLKDVFMGLMIYDSRSQRLGTIAARHYFKSDNGKYMEEQDYRKRTDFGLPFGLGVAGACFKQANRVFVLNRPSWNTLDDVGFFLRLPDRTPPTFMLEIPMDHPAFHKGFSFARSQQCIGVLDISSETDCQSHGVENLDQEKFKETWKTVHRRCQVFCDEMYEHFFSSSEALFPYTSDFADYKRESLTDYGDGMISIEVPPKADLEIPDQKLVGSALLDFMQQLRRIDPSIKAPSVRSSNVFSLPDERAA